MGSGAALARVIREDFSEEAARDRDQKASAMRSWWCRQMGDGEGMQSLCKYSRSSSLLHGLRGLSSFDSVTFPASEGIWIYDPERRHREGPFQL